MSGWMTFGLSIKYIYKDEYIAPEEVDKVHKILDLFKSDTELDADYEIKWSNEQETYITRLVGLYKYINGKVITLYTYDFIIT